MFSLLVQGAIVSVYGFDRTSFEFSLDNVVLTLSNQTHTYDKTKSFDTGNDIYNSSVYFCTSLFQNENENDNNNNSNLTIEFETYPTELTLIIRDCDTEKTYYSNNFDETTNNENSDNSNALIFGNIILGCLDIYIYDYKYDDISFDSSLNHVKYKILLNDEIIKYGGYFSSYELTSIYTYTGDEYHNDNNLCQYNVNRCNGVTINSTDGIIQSWSYKSHYNGSLLINSDNPELYFYGTQSFENGYLIFQESNLYDGDCYCDGSLSCTNTKIEWDFLLFAYFNVYCQGFYSCNLLSIESTSQYETTLNTYCLASDSCSKVISMNLNLGEKTGSTFLWNASLVMQGSLVALNSNLSLDYYWYHIEISGYYALYDSVIECGNLWENNYCFINCLDDSLQLFYVENTSSHIIMSGNCNNETTNDNITLTLISKMTELEELVQLATTTANGLCDDINGGDLVNDIGYPYNVDNDLINTNEKGYICCRGYRSCFGASAVISKIGNILCLAAESCRDTVLWNTDDESSSTSSSSTANNSTMRNSANIFCLSNGACADSTLKSQNGIYCLTPDSCSNTVILDGLFIYCTMDACSNSKITNVESIYLFDAQSGMTIFSNNIGEMDVYLRGLSAGSDVTIYCNENDFCFIDCGTQTGCNNLDLYCLGKCIVKCNETLGVTCPNMIYSRSPSAAPTNAPSNAPTVPPTPAPTDEPTYHPTEIPTANPTESSALTDEDIQISMQYVLTAVGSIVFLMILFGLIDSRCIRRNELFEYQSIIVFLFYGADFISDVCFSAKLLLRASNTSFLILFIGSVFFIILPIVFNLYQLHNEIKSWYVTNMNHATAGTATSGVALWITARIKLIYILAFISGSSFSAIELLNSYLFELEVFSMGLSKQQKAAFHNKRIFSVVLLENFPQLVIQVMSLIASAIIYPDTFDISGEVITILSLIFTLVSIGLSIAEFFLSKDLLGSQQCLLVTFEVNGNDFDEMTRSTFKSKIIFKRKVFIESLARILKIEDSAVERLKPIQTETGAIFTIIIDTFESDNSQKFEKSDVNKENLCKAIAQGYDMKSNIFISDLKISDNTSANKLPRKLTATQSLRQLAVVAVPTKTNIDTAKAMSAIIINGNDNSQL